MRAAPGQTLLIDADDTLWENNIYFERAIASFISYLNHQTYAPAEVRGVLNQVERENILTHGYGLHSFRESLITCFERISGPCDREKHLRISSFANAIADEEIEILPGVAETLASLSTRHRLLLVTKGDHGEQMDKLARSGLGGSFSASEVLPEKDPEAYLRIIAKHTLKPADTWMVGNSPKSDIHPALDAGLHAVFVRHENTWILEQEELREPKPPQRLIITGSFRELTNYF